MMTGTIGDAIEMETFENRGGATARLMWRPPGQAETVIPTIANPIHKCPFPMDFDVSEIVSCGFPNPLKTISRPPDEDSTKSTGSV